MKKDNKTLTRIKKKLIHLDELQNIEKDGLSPAAVLVPLVWEDEEWKLLFIHRGNTGEFHRGEVAFPGGRKEDLDRDLVETALRETNEELGIPPGEMEVLGFLRSLPTVTNYLVTPIVGILNWPQDLLLDSDEVERAFLIPVNWLSESKNWSTKTFIARDGREHNSIFYDEYDNENLWGMTARITQNLLEDK
jgi:8-oxo-dGTP pyrophosphatase MutT (NUDIX family)